MSEDARWIHISFGGPIHSLMVGQRKRWFELHPYFGPMLVNSKTHDPLVRQPGEHNPFWKAFEEWKKNSTPKVTDE